MTTAFLDWRRRLAREDRPAPFLRLGEVNDLLQHDAPQIHRRKITLRKINQIGTAVWRYDDIGAVVRFLDSRRDQHL